MFFTVLPEEAHTQGGASESDVFDKVQQQKDFTRFANSRTARVFEERGQDPGIAKKADMPLLEKDAPKNYAVEENELVADNKINDVDLNTITAEELASRPGLMLNMAARILYGYKHKTGHYAPLGAAAKLHGALALPLGPDPSGMADPFLAHHPRHTGMPPLERPRFERGMAELAIDMDRQQVGRLHQEQKQAAVDAMTDDDFSQLGIEIGGHLYWNDVAQILAVANIGQVPPEVDWARLYIMQLYSSLPDGTWKGTGRALENIFSSPLSYFGFGSVGAVRNLLRGATAKTVTGALKEKLLKGLMGSAWSATIGVEGASYGAMANYMHQRLLWDDENQGPFQLNVEQMKNAALIGGGLGAGLGAGIIGATKVAQKTTQAVRMWPTKQRVGAMAGGDGSVTMGAGYPLAEVVPITKDLSPGVDHVIPTAAATDLSPAGFYSAVRRAVDALPQEKGGASQMRAMIAKSEGVKAEEMAWIGLDDFLKGRKNVTKQEIADFVDANQVEVVPITKDLSSDAAREESMLLQERRKAGEITDAEFFAGEKAITERTAQYATGADNINLPGGENYREVLLTLPEQPVSGARYAIKGADGNNVSSNATTREEAIVEAGGDASRVIEIRGNDTVNPNFTAGHMDEPNVLAHIRMNDRTGPDGERILFVEEIQSDWHQLGRQKGYKKDTSNLDRELDFVESQLDELAPKSKANKDHIDAGGDRSQLPFPNIGRDIENFTDRRAELVSDMAKFKDGVPDAPFKKTWHEMSLRRVVRTAAEEGYDSVAWTPGKIQAERYDLSKQVNEIAYHAFGDETSVILKGVKGISDQDLELVLDGEGIIKVTDFGAPDDWKGKHIEDVVGKDIAENILTGSKKGRISGEGLQVGGEGMKGFYDKMLKAFATKFGKKFGAKVGTTKINTRELGEPGPFVSDDVRVFHDLSEEFWSDLSLSERRQLSAEAVEAGVGSTEVWTIPITPKMRESVLKKGVPLFSAAGAATATGAALSEQGTEPAS